MINEEPQGRIPDSDQSYKSFWTSGLISDHTAKFSNKLKTNYNGWFGKINYNGNKEGLWIQLYSRYNHIGWLCRIINYLDGKIDGWDDRYTSFGILNKRTRYEDGVKHGAEIHFSSHGLNFIRLNKYGTTRIEMHIYKDKLQFIRTFMNGKDDKLIEIDENDETGEIIIKVNKCPSSS